MSVDKMIKELENQAKYGDACLYDPLAIVAAIRAGQAMRDKLNRYSGQVYVGEDVTNECAAWDAATSDSLESLSQEIAKDLGEEY